MVTNTAASPFNTQKLREFAKTGSASEFAQELKATGPAILDEAIETFYKLDRERSDADLSLGHIRDLKSAVMSYVERNSNEVGANLAASRSLLNKSGSVQGSTTDGGVTHHIGAETNGGENVGTFNRLTGMQQFLRDLATVQGTFTAAVMLPGPASASMLSVLNSQHEALHASGSSSSQFSSDSSSSGAAGSLLLLAGGVKQSSSSSTGSSHSVSQVDYQKTTADREVIPVLTELRDRLERAVEFPATGGSVNINQSTWDSKEVTSFFGKKRTEKFNDKSTTRQVPYPVQSAFVELPMTSTDVIKNNLEYGFNWKGAF
jgi:hypothetical protein